MFFKRKKRDDTEIQRHAEDLLKAVAHGRTMDAPFGAGDVLPKAPGAVKDQTLDYLFKKGHLSRGGAEWRLTESGKKRALELLRAHRLVETYLAREEGLPTGVVHAIAEEVEHEFSEEKINALADAMKRPRFDPHGDPIPERAHDLIEPGGIVLAEVAPKTAVRIVHIEDEPVEDFLKLSELGLAVELPLRVLRQGGNETEIELAGESITLPARLATHIEVRIMEENEFYPESLRRLSDLKPRQKSRVEFISPACLGPERRRLLDFGLVPGSEVMCEFSSPFGTPTAYSLRGSMVALRKSQARNIFITEINE